MRSVSQCPQWPCYVPYATQEKQEENSAQRWASLLVSCSWSPSCWQWLWCFPSVMAVFRTHLELASSFAIGMNGHCNATQTWPPLYAEDGRITTLTHAVRRPNRTELLQIYNSLCLKTWQNQNVLSINYSSATRAAERRLGQRFPHSVSGPWFLAIKMHLGFKAGEEHLSLETNLPRQILRAKPIRLLPLCRWLSWKKCPWIEFPGAPSLLKSLVLDLWTVFRTKRKVRLEASF